MEATKQTGRKCGALILVMIIADETDDAAMAKWNTTSPAPTMRRWPGVKPRARDDPSTDPFAQPNKRRVMGDGALPTNQGVLCGSYAHIAAMLDEMSTVPGVDGVMMTFDDFVIGMEQFGTRIMPLMKCRQKLAQAA